MRLCAGIVIACCSVFCPAAGRAQSGPATPPQLVEQYGRLNLALEPAPGGKDSFTAAGRGYRILLTSRGAQVALRTPDRSTVVLMQLAGANPAAEAAAELPQPGHSNYFRGKNPARWRTGVPHYGRILYRGIYPGIDVAYYGNQGELEYDLLVAPGADPSMVAWSFEGITGASLTPTGDLALHTAAGVLRQLRPHIYQLRNGMRIEVKGRYVLTRRNRAALRLETYDRRLPLVVDPVLSYSTLLGGNAYDNLTGMFVDSAGNAYLAGYTYSSDFPLGTGPAQAALRGSADAFVTKLNASGDGIVYSTFLGGSDYEGPVAVAVDRNGKAYVTGSTNSIDFPVSQAAYRSAPAGGGDGFLAVLTPAGGLSYATYFGGNSPDSPSAIAVDSASNVYIAGSTMSADFPVTPEALLASYGGGSDGFLLKFADPASASAPAYSTYLGGSGSDSVGGIAADNSGNVYIAGQTGSYNFPTSPGAFQQVFTCCGSHAFLARINTTLGGMAGLVYSTFIAGYNTEMARGVAIDAAGNAYITGQTNSGNFPFTPGTVQPWLGRSGVNAFLAKFNPAGGLAFATALGNDSGQAVALDAAGNIYVVGNNSAPDDFPATADAFQNQNAGSPDAFLIKLNPNASAVLYATLLGGGAQDQALAVGVDASNHAYIAGNTYSSNMPVTTPAFQAQGGSRLNGGRPVSSALFKDITAAEAVAAGGVAAWPATVQVQDGFVARFDLSTSGTSSFSIGTSNLVFESTVTAAGNTAPQSQTVSLASTGAPATFSVQTFTQNQGTWLKVTPSGTTTPATLTVEANAAGLAPGYYGAEISLLVSGNTPGHQIVYVTLHVSKPQLGISTGFFTFFGDQGVVTPPSDTFTVSQNAGPGIPFTATATSSGWLSVTPSSGTTPATLTVNVSAAGLAKGTYSGTIRVQSPAAENGVQTVYVTLNVGPQLRVSAPSLWFSHTTTGQPPPPQLLSVTSSSTALAFTATSNVSWLSAAPSSGTTPATFSVAVDPASLGVGNHTGALTIASPGAANGSVTVTVTLNVSRPALYAPSTPLVFNAQAGSTTPPPQQSFLLTSSGMDTSVPFTAAAATSSGGNWLSVTPASGNTPKMLLVNVNQAGLAAGTYNGSITISSSSTTNANTVVPVVLNVGQLLSVAPGALFFTASPGTAAAPTQNLLISGGTGVAFTAAATTISGGNWLSVSPTAGATPGTLAVNVNSTGLLAGMYNGTITITSAGALNSPLTVPVTFVVGAVLQASPGSLSFDYAVGGAAPAAQFFTITTGNIPLAFTLSAVSTGNWLQVQTDVSITPATARVLVSPSALSPGVYTGTITINATGARNTPLSLNVMLTVARQIYVNPTALTFLALPGTAPPPQQVISITNDGAPLNFSTNVLSGGWLSASASGISPGNISGTGTPPGAITVSVNPAGLWEGNYTGTIIVTAPGAYNSPLAIAVSLRVLSSDLPPTAIAVTPSSGSGSAQVFSALYSDGDGAENLSTVHLMVAATMEGTDPKCHVAYDRSIRGLYLYGDDGTTRLGPVSPGTDSTLLRNAVCSVNPLTSYLFVNGQNLTLNVATTFKPGFGGAKTIFVRAIDLPGLDTGWASRGTFTVAGAAPKPGDFDGNGKTDIIWTNDVTRVTTVWFMNGSGGNTLAGFDFLAPGGVAGWTLAGAADFNADGYSDLVWQNDVTRQATIWYMGGRNGAQLQNWAWVNSGSPSPGWSIAAIADFNKDGTPDLVWVNDATRQVTLWYMGGAGCASLQSYTVLSVSGVPGWNIKAAADFDNNGIPDLVFVNDTTRQVQVWYMGGTGGTMKQSSAYISAAGVPGWTIAGAGDFNGDGTVDVIWQNDATRQATIWYLGSNLQMLRFDWVSAAGVPGWRIRVPH